MDTKHYYCKNDFIITFIVYNTHVTILNTYKIKDNKYKKEFIKYLRAINPALAKTRSMWSIFREIKAHNIFYQRGWKVNSTQHSDIEYKQKWWIKLAYIFICVLFREK